MEENRPLSLGAAYTLVFLGWVALAIATVGYFGVMAQLCGLETAPHSPGIGESLGAMAAGGAAYYLVYRLLD